MLSSVLDKTTIFFSDKQSGDKTSINLLDSSIACFVLAIPFFSMFLNAFLRPAVSVKTALAPASSITLVFKSVVVPSSFEVIALSSLDI